MHIYICAVVNDACHVLIYIKEKICMVMTTKSLFVFYFIFLFEKNLSKNKISVRVNRKN